MKVLRKSFPLFLTLFVMTAVNWSCQPLFTEGGKTELIHVGDIPLNVEIAATPEIRQRGLMYRKNLPSNEGMLFVFPKSSLQSFWMKNTLIPLDVGFFDDQGFLLEVLTMEPDDGKKIHNSAEPAKYALEVNKGWFRKNNLRRYAKLKLEADVRGL